MLDERIRTRIKLQKYRRFIRDAGEVRLRQEFGTDFGQKPIYHG